MPLTFSKRTLTDVPPNRLTLAREERLRQHQQLIDLTLSNPTRAGIDYPVDELAEAMARAARAPYDPLPLGIATAREAVAQHIGCDAAEVAITASTSEAYSFLFKLLTDPGDAIATAVPSYPLLDHLALMESVELRTLMLEFHRRWEIDEPALASAATGAKAVVVVSPNNPTGSYVRESEQVALAATGLPVISDEVFFDYPLEGAPPGRIESGSLRFILGGLSKSAGLPHFKLGWIHVSGTGREKALAALELIADNFLSVATPVQHALPDLLRLAPRIRAAISERTRTNLAALRATFGGVHSTSVLPVEAGWSAVIRVPSIRTDEEMALSLLERHGVLVHPGYFFDFAAEGHLVVSLLTPPDDFRKGIEAIRGIVDD